MNVINHSNHLTIQYLEFFWCEDANEFDWQVHSYFPPFSYLPGYISYKSAQVLKVESTERKCRCGVNDDKVLDSGL